MIPKYWKDKINSCKNCGSIPLSAEHYGCYLRNYPNYIRLVCPNCGQTIEQDFYTKDRSVIWKLLTNKWNIQNKVEQGETMNKEFCRDCPCLIDNNEEWFCDELQKPIDKVKWCMEQYDEIEHLDMSGVLDDYDDDELDMSGCGD